MGSTYRGPICGGRMKRRPLRKPYEEDRFEIMRGLFGQSLCKRLFSAMEEAQCRAPSLQRALFGWFLYKELLRLAGPHFAKSSLLGDFRRGFFVERRFAKGGSSSVQKRLSQSICRLPVLDMIKS